MSFPGVKRPGRGADHPLPPSAEVKGRVELYLYSPLGLHGWLYGEFRPYLAMIRSSSSRLLVEIQKQSDLEVAEVPEPEPKYRATTVTKLTAGHDVTAAGFKLF